MFIAPGLYAKEKRLAIPFVMCATLLFLGGVAFAHLLAFPMMWKFFASYQIANVQFLATLDDTFTMYVYTMLGAGFVFQMPLVVFVLARFGLVTAGFMLRKMKHAVLVIFVLAALITPSGDITTQIVFAAPMFVLYVVSIVVAWIFGKKRTIEA
jgi:sec-independent protein translocase protein TatC